MIIRNIEVTDYDPIIVDIDEWWGHRHIADLLPRLFFIHFKDTSFIILEDNVIVGFIIGFISQTYPEQAYVYFTGVNPDYRRKGYGVTLYDTFINAVKQRGCKSVHLIAAPVNRTSIAFHTQIGFQIEKGDYVADGVEINSKYDGRESR